MKRKGKGKMKKEQQTVFVYFDFEAQQDTGNHIAYLVCAQKPIRTMYNSPSKVKIVYKNSYNGFTV